MECEFHSSFLSALFAFFPPEMWEKRWYFHFEKWYSNSEEWDLKSGISLSRIIVVEKVTVNQYSFTTFNNF